MHAHISSSRSLIAGIIAGCASFGVVPQQSALAAPTPVIQSMALGGPAPFTVHVNALGSTLTAGDLLSARFEWDFGDAGAPFNKLAGWSAAHLYENPGTYQVKLTITDQTGVKATKTATINVQPPVAGNIYVSASGNDANSGATSSTAVRTVARAAQLLANNTQVHFRRGDRFAVTSEWGIGKTNVVLGAYGSGTARPVLDWAGSLNTTAAIIGFSGSADSIVIRDIEFDSAATTLTLSAVRGLHPDGQNLTVSNCYFRDVSYALNCERTVDGLFMVNCQSGVLGAYFSWAQGNDHVYVGNNCPGSESQHLIRFGGLNRCLIANNTFTNGSNSTLWCMLGSHAYVAGNTLASGRCIVGPNAAVGSPSERFPWAVFENNRMTNEGFGTTPGAEHIMIRNNVIVRDGATCITVEGHHASMNRTSSDVRIINNTGINNATSGRFVSIGTDVANVVVANNMYSARSLQTGSYQSANVFLQDGDMNGVLFRDNLWSNPAATLWGNGWHYAWPYWSDVNGYKNVQQWAAMANVHNEKYRTFTASDFNSNFRPTFNASVSAAIAGVATDYYGALRPVSGAWSAGAVELNPAPTEPTTIADINGDGRVDMNDLVMVITAWGACPSSPTTCPADIDGNGMVNLSDLVMVMTEWG